MARFLLQVNDGRIFVQEFGRQSSSVSAEQGSSFTKMRPILALANEFPWLLAPASLIAVMVITSMVGGLIRLTEKSFQLMVMGVLLALSGGALMVLLYFQ